MKIIPSRGYCLIEPLEADEVSAGGVILPDRVKDLPQKGKVLAVGKLTLEMLESDAPDTALDFKIGATVIFKRFVDNKIKEEGKELLLVRFEDILGIYEE